MQSEQQKEFYRLTDEASESLNSIAESGSYTHVFSYWRLPAFHNHTRTTLYVPKRPESDKGAFLTVATWDRNADLNKLRDPVERLKHPRNLKPSINEISIPLNSDMVTAAINDLSTIDLPSICPVEASIGLDGIRYRFSFSQGVYTLDISWWCDYPELWKNSTKRIEELVSRLENVEQKRGEQNAAEQPASRSAVKNK